MLSRFTSSCSRPTATSLTFIEGRFAVSTEKVRLVFAVSRRAISVTLNRLISMGSSNIRVRTLELRLSWNSRNLTGVVSSI